jgi:D-alanine-D-alanine ligase
MSIQTDPDWWKTLFDEIYLTTDARSVCDDELTRREVDAFCQMVPMDNQDRILDLCGGHGRHSLELSRRGFTGCTVFDYSEALLQKGSANAQLGGHRIEFVQGDARRIHLPDASFDHVLILGNSLGYIPDPESDRKILTGCLRLLKPGGWLLVDVTDGRAIRDRFTPNAWHEIGEDVIVCRHREIADDMIHAREVVLSRKGGLIRDRTYCMRLYGASDLKKMVTGTGFDEVQVHCSFQPHECEGDFGFMNHRMIVTAKKP